MTKSLHALRQHQSLLEFGMSTALFQGSRLIAELITMSLVGPTLFGIWKLLQLLFIYAPLIQLGIINGANRNIPYYRGLGDHLALKRTAHASFSAAFVGSLLCGILSIFIGNILIRNLVSDLSSSLSYILGISVALWTLLSLLLSILRSFEFFRIFSLVQIVVSIGIILTLPLVIRLDLNGYLISTSIAATAGCIVAVYFLRHQLMLGWHWATIKNLIALGLPILIVGLAYSFLSTVDRILISCLLGQEALGHYSLAILTFGTLSLLPLTISQYYYPRISHILGSSGSAIEALKVAKKQIQLAVSSTALISLVVALLIPWLVPYFLPEYLGGIYPALALIPGLVCLSFVGGYANWLNSVKKQFIYLWMQVIAIILNIVFSLFFFVLGWELVGIAAGSALALMIYAIMLHVATHRILRHMSPKVTL